MGPFNSPPNLLEVDGAVVDAVTEVVNFRSQHVAFVGAESDEENSWPSTTPFSGAILTEEEWANS